MSELYKKIEMLCQENNTNITELCRELKMPRSPLSELKAGRSKTISVDKLQKIADYFNVSLDWLIGLSKFKNNIAVSEYYSGWNNYPIDFEPPFDFCPLLAELRKEQGVSCEDMAAAIGATVEQYMECEEGILPISYEQAEKLSNILGSNASQILFDNGLYAEQVPEAFHNDVRKWEILKKASDDEAMREAFASTSDADIKIVARHLEDIPKDKREELIKTINSTIDLYKKAIGYNKNGG